MQDRFKFRIYGHSQKKMISTSDLGARDLYYGAFVDNRLLEFYFGKGHFTIMQCTGLKDKNGKLIFEGDIVNFKFGNEYKSGKVEYLQTIWSVSNAEFVNRDYVGGALINLYRDCEVIGNIYENPELSKGITYD